MKRVLMIFFMGLNLLALGQENRIWATYYGGASDDYSKNIATDVFGNIYIVGTTHSTTGIAIGGFQNTYGGNMDAFLVKIDPAGNLLWSTYYGGNGSDEGYSVTTDISGNIYMTGSTTSTSGIHYNGHQHFFGGVYDAFLIKFDSEGNRLWATYYGGAGDDGGRSITTDIHGNIYLSGFTASTTNIATQGFQNSIGGDADAFVVKFNSSGNRLWATYYGGATYDEGYCLATGEYESVYLAGYTTSISNIASEGFQDTIGGWFDAFIVKFDSTGNRLWATYYGGAEYENGYSVTTDISSNVYLAGYSTSTTNIAYSGFQDTLGGGVQDAFLVKFDTAGNRLWASYYGGAQGEIGNSVSTDYMGNVYLTGITTSNSGISSDGFQNNLVGVSNQFVVKFDSVGTRKCATYYGQSKEMGGYGATDINGNTYIVASTPSITGISSNGFQNANGGGMDSYLVKLDSCGSLPSNINNYILKNLSLYPNPATSTLTIQNASGLYHLSDITGKTLLSGLVSGESFTLDISALSSGVYFLTLLEGGQQVVRKVIKQ